MLLEMTDDTEMKESSDTGILPQLMPQLFELLKNPAGSVEGPDNSNVDLLKKLPVGKGILDDLRDLRVNALIAISNIAQNSPDLLENIEDLESKVVCLISEKEDEEVLRSAIDCTRSLVQSKVVKLSVEHIKIFSDIIKRSASNPDSDQVTAISCIKILGSVASQTQDSIVISSVSSLLLQILEEDFELNEELSVQNCHLKLLVTAEVLDTIIDIFAEDLTTDEVIIKMKLLPRLSNLDKTFCSMVKKLQSEKKAILKKKDAAVIQTVAQNVKRFIRYKTKKLYKKT